MMIGEKLTTNWGAWAYVFVALAPWVWAAPLVALAREPEAQVVYVNASAIGANDGTSWADAYVDLQDALDFAAAHPETNFDIWVAAGIYKPDRGTGNREATFAMRSGLALYGGFAGWESALPQRDIARNETILNGDLLGNDDPNAEPASDCGTPHDTPGCSDSECEALVCDAITGCCHPTGEWNNSCVDLVPNLCCGAWLPDRCDNARHVVTAQDADDTTRLNGLTISGAHAHGYNGTNSIWGGGLLAVNSDLTVSHCVFTQNHGDDGGAIGLVQGTNARIEHCTFHHNQSFGSAGIFIDYDGGSPLIQACDFENNIGIALRFNDTTAVVTNCHFVNNEGLGAPVILYHGNDFFFGCEFSGNTGTALAIANGDAFLVGCRFIENLADEWGWGGALAVNAYSLVTVTDCFFIRNQSGAISVDNAGLIVTNSEFIENQAERGGAINSEGSFAISDSLFEGNFAADSYNGVGGAIRADSGLFGGAGTIERCFFRQNSAVGAGGAVATYSVPVDILDSLFINNWAGNYGGAITVGSDDLVSGCTFSGNAAAQGGAILTTSHPPVFNSVLWNNREFGGGGESAAIRGLFGGQVHLDYSCVEGWTGALGGVGNTGDDPLFVDPIGSDGLEGTGDEDFRLSPNSTLINAGDPTFIPHPEDADLDGHVRVLCDRVDMGAYEFGIGDYNCDRVLEISDFASWPTCMTGPSVDPYTAECEAYDFHAEVDDRIDLLDFAGFQNAFGH